MFEIKDIKPPPARPEPNKTPTPRPTLMTKWTRLKIELKAWRQAGYPVASKATRRQREAICKACPKWSAKGNWGLGECTHPKCGCTKAKIMLATSKCPDGKWDAEPPLNRHKSNQSP